MNKKICATFLVAILALAFAPSAGAATQNVCVGGMINTGTETQMWFFGKSNDNIDFTFTIGENDYDHSTTVQFGKIVYIPEIKQNLQVSDVSGNCITVHIDPIPKGSGDVNEDGQITIIDALYVAQYIVGLRTLTTEQIAAADVNGDGFVTIADALSIAQGIMTTPAITPMSGLYRANPKENIYGNSNNAFLSKGIEVFTLTYVKETNSFDVSKYNGDKVNDLIVSYNSNENNWKVTFKDGIINYYGLNDSERIGDQSLLLR